MQAILDHFKTITAIPRCSLDAIKMKDYIVNFAKKHGFDVKEDSAGNVLCLKGSPKVCLQAHYDMVCIGDAPVIECVQEEMLLKAKHSTLGADNGMGMAIMFWMMETHEHLECLFTADEEVGLLGAMAFSMPLYSSYVLNLDAEEAGEIYIGCAGGVDVLASLRVTYAPLESDVLVYEVCAHDFLGGHSGVDIDKEIPSAIKALASELMQHDVKLISIHGGERRNAIPKSATAIIATREAIYISDKRLSLRALEPQKYHHTIVESSRILHALAGFAQGVRSWDKNLHIPSVSINLGVLAYEHHQICLDCAARAMDDEKLSLLAAETMAYFKGFGFDVTQEGWHGAWKPEANAFAHKVQEVMQTLYPYAQFKAIHAGLECGELIARQPKKIEAVSIGPTIRYPHSLREECDVASVEKIATIVDSIISSLEG